MRWANIHLYLNQVLTYINHFVCDSNYSAPLDMNPTNVSR